MKSKNLTIIQKTLFTSTLLAITVTLNAAHAQDKTLWEKTKEAHQNLQESLDRTPRYRNERDISITGSYGYFDFWTFGKYGVAISKQSANTAWDFEYQHGSIGISAIADIGDMTEDRVHLLRRSYGERGTFNWYGGLYYNKFKVEIGDDTLATISGNSDLHYDVVELQTAVPIRMTKTIFKTQSTLSKISRLFQS